MIKLLLILILLHLNIYLSKLDESSRIGWIALYEQMDGPNWKR